MLIPFADDVWIDARPLRFLGIEMGTRMTVVRLASGGLFVHSPVALDEGTREAIDALGPVQVIVAPNLFHHLFVGAWAAAYPAAMVAACPGLAEKRADLAVDVVLGDTPDAAWRGEIDHVFFGAFALANEMVFFHRKSGTILSSDLVLDLARHPSALTRAAAFCLGLRVPGPTWLEHVLIHDRVAAREQIERILAWEADRLVLAHGDVVERGATRLVHRAYRWL
jgi:hypothetical protein